MYPTYLITYIYIYYTLICICILYCACTHSMCTPLFPLVGFVAKNHPYPAHNRVVTTGHKVCYKQNRKPRN